MVSVSPWSLRQTSSYGRLWRHFAKYFCSFELSKPLRDAGTSELTMILSF